ncbi:hypothetical protein ACO2Q9_18795 [Variovorax sp. VNK109]|jgi:hypothetical protein|uniref:hypothetical protein n=1 Tax=Variovorax sp. VNK109 TaxID=3400919 RepID=UPI003BFB5524
MKSSLPVLLLLNCTLAGAAEPSNFGAFTYPQANCTKPSKPVAPIQLTTQQDANLWNLQVSRYQAEQNRYVQCVNAYIAAAQADLKRISDSANQVVEEANKP